MSSVPQTPHFRGQQSLEGVLSFSLDAADTEPPTPPPTPHDLTEAYLLYTTILHDCHCAAIPLYPTASMPLLHNFFLSIYEYCPSISGKSNILFVVLHALFPAALEYNSPTQRVPAAVVSRAKRWLHLPFSPDQRAVVYRTLQTLADDLLRGFFIPLKACGGQTPTVSPLITPRTHGEVGPQQGTPSRLSGLRAACLLRDGHRCVVTRAIDIAYQENYNLLNPDSPSVEDNAHAEVAHIIPHSFNAINTDGSLGHSRTYIWRIMNMFDPGVSHELAGAAIASPLNAITLCHELHYRFGQLKWYLEPTPVPHTYTMKVVRGHILPRALRPAGPIAFNVGAGVAPPDPRLIAFHRACCLMLCMSGAAACVDHVLRDMEETEQNGVLAADGTSDLALFWKLKEVLGEVVAY